MQKKHHIIEGEFYFGDDVMSVSTLLGSCVAVVVWHPKFKVGGMCHIVLPEHGKMDCTNKYATCAIAEITRYVKKIGTYPKDYITCIYGGGEMFPVKSKSTVGSRNVDTVKKILAMRGYKIHDEHIGGQFYRKIKLNIKTGKIDMEAVDIERSKKEVAAWAK